MQITDHIHGTFSITEPVLLELLESKPIQRLKHINQYGCTQLITPGATVTRYEHSVGVMLLLRKLGASTAAQAAGLLHDASHTAFSHVADYLMDNHEETYHEQVFERVLGSSEVPSILETHGFDPAEVFEEHNYPLLERDAPDLCADRTDYALRDHSEDVPGMDGARLGRYLTAYDDRIVFTQAEAAAEFAREYLRLDKTFWASPREAAANQLLADAMRIAMEAGCLSEEDLFSTDKEVLHHLRNCDQKGVQDILARLTPDFAVQESDSENADLHVQVKCRFVDPHVLIDGRTVRVSEITMDYADGIALHREWCKLGHDLIIL